MVRGICEVFLLTVFVLGLTWYVLAEPPKSARTALHMGDDDIRFPIPAALVEEK